MDGDYKSEVPLEKAGRLCEPWELLALKIVTNRIDVRGGEQSTKCTKQYECQWWASALNIRCTSGWSSRQRGRFHPTNPIRGAEAGNNPAG